MKWEGDEMDWFDAVLGIVVTAGATIFFGVIVYLALTGTGESDDNGLV